jgi:serine/threonine protein kinase
MENVMVKYKPGCGILKLGDFGHAILNEGDRRIGGTFAYTAPENVIGLKNKGCLGDIFSSAIVLMEIVCRATLMPESLLSAYKNHIRGGTSAVAMTPVQLYHLVILSSVIAQRPVYTGFVVRRYFGNIPKHRVIDMLKSHFPSFKDELYSIIVRATEASPCQTLHDLEEADDQL